MGEDHRAVLRADIVALPVKLGRIVDRKENIENLAVTDRRWIEFDLHDFRVAGVAVAHLLVSRTLGLAARIARLHGADTLDAEKHGFETPKTSASECGGFNCLN